MDPTFGQINAPQISNFILQMMQRRRPPVDAEDTVGPEQHENRDSIRLLIRMRYGTSRSEREDWILEECKMLFAQDYICRYVDNLDNNIPGIHPKVLVIPIAEKRGTGSQGNKRMNYDVVKYLEQAQDPNCRDIARFPCPVILCNGKYICRSKCPPSLRGCRDEPRAETSCSSGPPRKENNIMKISELVELMTKGPVAQKDADFLKSIDVRYLSDITNSTECDFKGEIMNSETLKNVYKNIEIISMPYPSRENFTPDSKLNIQETTKEYLLTLIRMLVEGEGGILIQSFRGLDRTALFISILRLSLWADGLVHKTLTEFEIIFLTLGYDWYLFGYKMNENGTQFQDIIEFFFNFLPLISSEEFSMYRMLQARNEISQDSSEFREVRPSRHALLKEISRHFLESLQKSTQYIDSFNKRTKK